MITAEYFIDVFKYHNKPEYTRQEIEFAIKSASEYIDLIVTQGKLKHDETLEFDDKGLLSGGKDSEKVEQIKTAICRTTLFCLDNGFDFLSGSSMASAGDFSITDNIDFAVSIKNLDNYLYAIFSKYYDLNILKHQDLTNVQEPKDNDRTMFVSGADRELISAKEMRKQINEWGANNITAISPIKIEKQIPEDNSSLLRLTLDGSDIKGPPGEPGKPGKDGDPGKPGRDGKDGINAFKKIKVNNESLTPKQPITLEIDAPNSTIDGDNHTIKLKVRDGRDGKPGRDGKDGNDGQDGKNGDATDFFKKSPGGGEWSKVDKLPLGMNQSRISELKEPEVSDDAATKKYVDKIINDIYNFDSRPPTFSITDGTGVKKLYQYVHENGEGPRPEPGTFKELVFQGTQCKLRLTYMDDPISWKAKPSIMQFVGYLAFRNHYMYEGNDQFDKYPILIKLPNGLQMRFTRVFLRNEKIDNFVLFEGLYCKYHNQPKLKWDNQDKWKRQYFMVGFDNSKFKLEIWL